MKKYLITVAIFFLYLTSLGQVKTPVQPSIISGSSTSNLLFHQILSFYVAKEIKLKGLNNKFRIDLFSVKFKLSDSLSLIEYEESIGIPKQLLLSLQPAFNKAIDTCSKLGIIASKFKNKNIVVPIYIYNNPRKEKVLNVETSLNEIEDVFLFKTSLSSVISKYDNPCDCITIAPIIIFIPDIVNHSNKYKKYKKPTQK